MPARLLDVTRSVQRTRHATPSGIDRVERAYLHHSLGGRGSWLLCRIGGRQYLISPESGPALVRVLDREDEPLDLLARLQPGRERRLRAAESAVRRLARDAARTADLRVLLARNVPEAGVYLNVGHDNLGGVVGEVAAGGLAPVVLLHDTIPLDFPQFARPGIPERFEAKFHAALGSAHLLLNSEATREAVSRHAARVGLVPPESTVIPLGIDAPSGAPRSAAPGRRAGMSPDDGAPTRLGHPSFVCLGTIEGRKNHRLLLRIWRRWWETRPPGGTPHLHIIGRRGWRAAEVFAQLDHAPMIGRTVFEWRDLPDAGVAARLAHARALLFPSFAEGYGLPLAEALSGGVPVIASDVSALREVGRDVPEWLDPRDEEGWAAAIDAYAAEPSSRREAQLARLASWSPATWRAHFAELDCLLEGLLGRLRMRCS